MRRTGVISVLFGLLFGAACVFGVELLMRSVVSAEVSLRLIPEGGGGTERRLWIRLFNMSERGIRLSSGGLEYFVFAPADGSGEYVVHVRHNPRKGGEVFLGPGGSVDVGDAYPLLRNLPSDAKSVSGVYAAPESSGLGIVRSPALEIER